MSDERPLGDDAIETSSRIGHPRESPRSTGPIEFVGEYKILGKLGEGGMGVVYEAEQASPRRRVALKIVRGGGFADPQQARLLEKEANALARLRHPGIAAIYEAGRTEDGLGFFAMEIVRGTSLGRYLELHSPELSPSEVRRRLALFRKIADAVHYAHQRGVLHRDLKPSNIFVTTEAVSEGALPEVKILDFGLARITDADVANVSRSIEVGVIKGTLSYMSPEQARGNPDEIDIRSDVYALGVILYELLTGARPYELSHVSLLEAIRIIEHEAPRPMRDAYVGSGKLDPDLVTIVLKALEKDPARRYGSAAALSEDVGRFLASEPIHARPPTVVYQARKFASRNKVLVAGATATVLALVGGITASTILGFREAAQRREAEKARDDLQAVAAFQAEMLQRVRPEPAGQALVRSMRSRIEEARKRAGDGPEEVRVALDDLDRALQGVNTTDLARDLLVDNILQPADAAVRSGFGERPAIEARLRESIGKTYKSLGAYDQADVEAQRLLEIARTTGSGLDDALRFAGDVALARGRFDDAIGRYDEGLALAGDEAVGSHRSFELRNAKVRALWSAGRYDEAEPMARSLLEEERNDLGPDAALTLDTQNLVAVVDWGRGRIAEAANGYESVLAARTRLFGSDDPDTDDVRNNLAVAYWRLGRYGEAERLLVDTVRSRTRRLGEDHPATLGALGTLAVVYYSENRFVEAEAIQRRILSLQTRALGEEHVATLRTMNNLAVVLTKLERYDEAEAMLTRAISLFERTRRADHPDFAATVHSLGELELARGRYPAARRDLERAQRIYAERGHPNLGSIAVQLAEVNARLGDAAACRNWLRDAKSRGALDPAELDREIYRKALGADDLAELRR